MFWLLRLILGSFLLIFLVCAVSRTKLVHKKTWYIIIVTITVALVSVSAVVPLENVFYTFKTPHAAYNYYNFGKTDIKLVFSGKNSDLVVGDKNNSNVYLIIPKTASGWKIGIGVDTKKVLQKIIDNIVICVYQYKNTDDYFITVLDTKGETLEVKDSRDSNFLTTVRKNDAINKSFISYHTSVFGLDREYWLSINGNIVSLV